MFIGIDVSKDHLDVALRPTGESSRVSNDPAGITRLLERVSAAGAVLIVLESAGGYENATVAALGSAGLPVVVVNPRAVRGLRPGHGEAGEDRLDRRRGARALRGTSAAAARADQ